ncbi:MAG: triose-phosphate isomerase [Acholeplasmataceae bacterium]|nr:triose-phosphate isomerase [Acholeplasmataceae bacterium]
MRKPIIAGNWKMYKDRDEALYFILKVAPEVPDPKLVETVICAQAPLLRCLIKRQGDHLRIGAQNMFYLDEGAYTGEISGKMLKSYNVSYVIIGHSERRHLFHETDCDVEKKTKAALRNHLIPIVCVGETLAEREENNTMAVLHRQLTAVMQDLTPDEMKKLVIAYEPVWAIGTGKTATGEQAEEACGYLRQLIQEGFGKDVAEELRILYGGSVKPSNIDELLEFPNIDGALIGGASLDPDQFLDMAKAALKHLS